MEKTFYITTAIDYPNAIPHIGTAFEKIGADVYARFSRFQGKNVFFSIGNDENTVKVRKAAGSESVQDYADRMAEAFKLVWHNLDISYDAFIQTSEQKHHVGVGHFLEVVKENGFIEKRHYNALYCDGCEEFKTENNIIDGHCQNHPNMELIERKEENWFFLLSKFKDKFPEVFPEIIPESRLNEMNQFVNNLEDISISRKNEGWGIPIPWDDSQVVYVWFDALLNYLTVVGFGTDSHQFNQCYPADVHFIGKDITRFHAVLFPAMCLAYGNGLKLPKRIFSHGFVYERHDGVLVKSSKSGGGLNPMDLVSRFGSDAYRYYFLSKFNFAGDGEYSLQHFESVYNSDLVNNIGNLTSRIIGMVIQWFDGCIGAGEGKIDLLFQVDLAEYQELMEKFEYRMVLESILENSSSMNVFINDVKPWSLVKTDKIECQLVMYRLVKSLIMLALLLKPFIPKTSRRIYDSFIHNVSWDEVWLSNMNTVFNHGDVFVVNPDVLDKEKKFIPIFPRTS